MAGITDGLTDEEKQAISDKYELDYLDKRIMAFTTKFPTITQLEMAKKFKVSTAEIRARLNKPSFLRALDEYSMTTDELIIKGQQQAVKVLINMLGDTNKSFRLKAAQLLLTPKLTPKAGQNVNNNNAVVFQTKIGSDGTLRQQIGPSTDVDIQLDEVD